jgi:peptide/nickel transport system permease protein
VRFVQGRVVHLVLVLFVVTLFSFMLTSLLPGDAALSILGPGAQPKAVEALRQQMHLDQPLPVRYGSWLHGAVTGDLGRSIRTQQTVTDAIRQRLPVTLELLLLSELIALVVAVPVGVSAAYRSGGFFDRVASGAAFGILAVPGFVLAIVLIYALAVALSVFPATGYAPFFDDPVQNLRSFFLPALTLGLADAAVYMRLLRSDMIATLQEDFVTMARAKGLSPARILWRHALRPSSLTLLTVAGLNVGALISGALIVEVIFGLNGMGFLINDAINRRQYIALQDYIAVVAIVYVLVNFAVDFLYRVLDPRIRGARIG